MSQILNSNLSTFSMSVRTENDTNNDYVDPIYYSVISESLKKISFRVKLSTDEDGRIVAKCDDLQGVVTDGATENEALINVKEAIDAVLEANNRYNEYNIIVYT